MVLSLLLSVEWFIIVFLFVCFICVIVMLECVVILSICFVDVKGKGMLVVGFLFFL